MSLNGISEQFKIPGKEVKMFKAILKDILFRAQKKGFSNRGICAYFFLFWSEKKLTFDRYKEFSDLFPKYKPTENLFPEFYNHPAFRKGDAEFWWFKNEEGNQQRILFLEHLIKTL